MLFSSEEHIIDVVQTFDSTIVYSLKLIKEAADAFSRKLSVTHTYDKTLPLLLLKNTICMISSMTR